MLRNICINGNLAIKIGISGFFFEHENICEPFLRYEQWGFVTLLLYLETFRFPIWLPIVSLTATTYSHENTKVSNAEIPDIWHVMKPLMKLGRFECVPFHQ